MTDAPPCEKCGSQRIVGTYTVHCPTCLPVYNAPCAWCGSAFAFCRCDGCPPGMEAAFEAGWRPDGWERSAQGLTP